jgi:hypothetical protein
MSGEIIGLVAVVLLLFGGPLIWGVTDTIMSNWRKAKIAEQDAVLKQNMIERGFTADEIEQVLNSTSEPSKKAKARS